MSKCIIIKLKNGFKKFFFRSIRKTWIYDFQNFYYDVNNMLQMSRQSNDKESRTVFLYTLGIQYDKFIP